MTSLEKINCVTDLYNHMDVDVADFLSSETWGEYYDDECDEYGYMVSYGASKLVILNKELGHKVLKIPFISTDYIEPEYKEQELENPSLDNYCLIESKIYEKARKIGIEDMFAKTSYVGKGLIDGHSIEIYESDRADMNSVCAKLSEEYDDSTIDILSSIKDADDYFDYNTASCFIKDYGIKKAKRLFNFIVKQGINDLRRTNVGTINGKIVLTDYSGFYD